MLGLGDRIGTIEDGKLANLIITDVIRPRSKRRGPTCSSSGGR